MTANWNNESKPQYCEESYNEGDDREEEEHVRDRGREESVSFALKQHHALLKHQVEEGKQHAVDHHLQNKHQNQFLQSSVPSFL